MGVFEHFPYTNFHDLNLDKIMKRTNEAEANAQQAANDAAAAAAGIAAANSKSTEALSKANAAVNTANGAAADAEQALTYSRAKATHSFEIIIDDQNSTITVTDCATGDVLTPLTAWQLVNAMFGLALTAADLVSPTLAAIAYPEAADWPNVKIVNAYQPIYVAEGTVAFQTNGYLSITWLKPGSTPAMKTLTCSMNQGFTYSNCTIV